MKNLNLKKEANRLIRQPDHKRETMFQDGDTNDIISVILHADQFSSEDTRDFAKVFKPNYKGMRSLWQFVKENIAYIADQPGHEKVKGPAQTWYDGYGDCKSFSILTGSILQNIGVKYSYRFAAYMGDPEVSHVYVIAHLPGRQVILDAVHTHFDDEVPYSSKEDIKGVQLAGIAGVNSVPNYTGYLVPVLSFLVGVSALKLISS